MNRIHPIEERRDVPTFAFEIVAAAVVIAIIIAAGDVSMYRVSTSTVHATAVAAPAPANFEYFPEGYALDAAEPATHIEAF